MHKTTVYLEDELRRALARVAREEGRSEAEVIRDALRERVLRKGRPSPRSVGRGRSGDPRLAERDEEILERLVARGSRRRR